MPIKRAPKRIAIPTSAVAVTVVPTLLQWSQEQLNIIDWVVDGIGNAMIEAVAGSGKTSILKGAGAKMRGTKIYCAYNKSIAEEIREAIGHMPYVTVSTFHAIGLGDWSRHIKKTTGKTVKIDEKGKRRLILEKLDVPWNLRNAVWALASIAKQNGVDVLWDSRNGDDFAHDQWFELCGYYSILEDVEEVVAEADEKKMEFHIVQLAIRCVNMARQMPDVVDFDDMIWLPLVENVTIRQYDWVLGDEFQDVNPIRREYARRLMAPGGRALFVADPFQNIYGFTGSGTDAVERTIEDFECKIFPLTSTFRCCKAATTLAQTFVPHITAHAKNAEGKVEYVDYDDFVDRLIYGREGAPQPGDAILCRNTRPLVSLAMKMIRKGIGCHVEGRDIGANIMTLIKKWKKFISISDLETRIRAWGEKQAKKFVKNDQMYKIEGMWDKVETALALLHGCNTLQDVERKIERMFSNVDSTGAKRLITLSTVHKAKGREWDHVFILGWNRYMPSKWAKQQWELDTERNLQYVAVTRAKQRLTLVMKGDDDA